MSPEQWQQVQRHFHALCNLSKAEQTSTLAGLSLEPLVLQQLRQLLDADSGADSESTSLDQLVSKVGQIAGELQDHQRIGAVVGAYRLIRLLGEGGMGDVYLAERSDGRFEAQVAVKFLATGGRHNQRLFDRERRVLARLKHPDIAHLIDAGEDGRFGAYLVMEYVDGQALDQFARVNAISVPARLRWISRAARAVAFAHQNLVLHRDLKPDHLMVTNDGRLKVLDFGVAGLINPQAGADTQQTQASFTPLYAAPEQLLNQAASTRTDVYALGLILYQVLSGGSSPFGDDPEQVSERKLSEQAARLPALPGMPARQTRDLRLIIEKATARDPLRRYAGPAEMADDLERICTDQPISLRAPAMPEASWRWLLRHRVASVALAIAVLALIGSAGFSALFAHRAQIERDVALVEAEKARSIATFLESIFETASPGTDSGPDMRARDLLEHGRERIARELIDQPAVAASLEIAIARSYLNLGLYEDALAVLETQRADIQPQRAAERLLLMARLDTLIGDHRRALTRLDGAQLVGMPGNLGAEAHIIRATAHINLGKPQLAEQAARTGVAEADDTPAGLKMQLSAQTLLGAVALGRGDLDTAKAIYSEIYRLSRLHHGEVNDITGMALNNLAGVAFMSGDLITARDAYLAAIDTYEQFFGVDNRAMGLAQRSLGLTYRRLGQAKASEQTLRRAMSAFEGWNGRDNLLFQEAAIQLMELQLMLGHDGQVRQLLNSLPVAEVPGGTDNQAVVCRLYRLHETMTDGPFDERAALPPPSGNCLDGLNLPEYVWAFDLYLQARHSQLHNDGLLAERIRAARALTAALVPPDPLLLDAISQLQ